jgi:glycerophosphoryl diester phosphodiesterase
MYELAGTRGRPLLGGHRGNPAEHPENTLASFRSAIELGVEIIECDVHLSSDGELVVIHDHTLDRTTDGAGLVFQYELAELRALDAGGGERLPLLSEVGELARGRVGLCVETKQVPIPYPGLEEKLVETLRALELLDQTCVVSFHHSSVKRVKELEPRLLAGVLVAGLPIDPAGLLRAAAADVYAPNWGTNDPQAVAQIHQAGGVVGVWTVDDDTGLEWSLRCGVDSLFTNRPREMLDKLRAGAAAGAGRTSAGRSGK